MNIASLSSNRKVQFASILLVVAGLTWTFGRYSGFFVSLNDFWTVVYYGRHMTWEYKESLYNGFYPFGYAFIIGQLPYTYVIQLAYLMNAILAGLLAASVSMLVMQGRYFFATLVAVLISITQPLVFHYGNTPGPDIGAAAFPALAIYLLWKDAFASGESVDRNTSALLIGASLGAGCLWRSHVIVLAVVVLILAVIFRRLHSIRQTMWMFVGFALILSVQVTVDVLSGHTPLETAQMFNIYKLLYGIDWANPPTPEEISKLSIAKLLIADPSFVLRAAWPYFRYLVSFAYPAVILVIISPRGVLRQFAAFSVMAILIYSLPLSLSDSARAPLAVISLTLGNAALMLIAIRDRFSAMFPTFRRPQVWVAILVVLGGVYPLSGWIQANMSFMESNRVGYRIFKDMEYILIREGLSSPDQVFSNRYSYYLPTRPPYTTRHLSYTSNDWMWGFAEEYPPISNESWEAFRKSCLEQGIQFIVITDLAVDQGEFFSIIYENEFDEQAMGIEFIAQRTTSRMFKFK